MTTLNYATIKAAASALHKAETAIDTSNAGRTKATKTLVLAVGGFFAANKGADVAPLLPIIYGDKWAGFAPTVQKSRKTEWATVATISATKGRLADCIAAAEATDKDFRASFFRAATFAKNNASADGNAIKAALTEKKAPVVRTAGDRFEAIMGELAAMVEGDRDAFALIKAHAVGIQNVFNAERGKGKLRFARELAKKTVTKAAMDFAAV